MKRGIFAVGLSLAACIATVAARAETLDNDSVVALVSAGLGDEVVIAKIKSSPARYRLSTEDLIALKKNGVFGPVIAAMIEAGSQGITSPKAAMSADLPDPLVPHPYGIYRLVEDADPAHMAGVDPTLSNQNRREEEQ